MWVKICANTSLDDTLLAIDAGADAVGFIFAPSKRQVTAEQVAGIAARLPQTVETIGVHVSQDAEEIVALHRTAELRTTQLHGPLNLPLIRQLSTALPEMELIQSLAWELGDTGPHAEFMQQLASLATAFPRMRVLVDSKASGNSGGTGIAFNWQAAAACLALFPQLRIIIAGGLDPQNVTEAISTLHPWGVDVASGVEASAGKKSAARVKAFVANAKTASRPTAKPA